MQLLTIFAQGIEVAPEAAAEIDRILVFVGLIIALFIAYGIYHFIRNGKTSWYSRQAKTLMTYGPIFERETGYPFFIGVSGDYIEEMKEKALETLVVRYAQRAIAHQELLRAKNQRPDPNTPVDADAVSKHRDQYNATIARANKYRELLLILKFELVEDYLEGGPKHAEFNRLVSAKIKDLQQQPEKRSMRARMPGKPSGGMLDGLRKRFGENADEEQTGQSQPEGLHSMPQAPSSGASQARPQQAPRVASPAPTMRAPTLGSKLPGSTGDQRRMPQSPSGASQARPQQAPHEGKDPLAVQRERLRRRMAKARARGEASESDQTAELEALLKRQRELEARLKEQYENHEDHIPFDFE